MGTTAEAGIQDRWGRLRIEKCEKCGGKMKVIVEASHRCIEEPEVIDKILKHLGLDQPGDPQNQHDQPTTLF